MSKKSLLIIFVIILVIASGFFVYRNWLIKVFSEYQVSLSAPTVSPESKDATIFEDSDKYKIDIKYPEFSGVENAEALNKMIKDKFQERADTFKTDADQNAIAEVGAPSELQVGYEEVFFTGNAASLKFGTLYYIAGMAHPNSYSESLNYDFKNNKEISLADLFTPGTDYLAELSSISRGALKTQIEQIDPGYYSESFVNPGTEPKEENFSVFNFDKDKLIVTFNPYQVGPWVLGEQLVQIPFSQLTGVDTQKDFLK